MTGRSPLPRGVGRALLWRPWQVVTLMARFPIEWLSSRPWLRLIAAAPAAAGLVVIGLALDFALQPASSLADRYHVAATDAFEKEDFKTADLYYRKLGALDPLSEAATFGQALTAARQGADDRARRMMQTIAPEERTGFPAAHLWLAQDMIRSRAAADAAGLKRMEHHLQAALDIRGDRTEVHVLLSQLYLVKRDLRTSVRHMEQAAAEKPALQMRLAQLYALQGDTARATATAKEAALHWEGVLRSSPGDLDARFQLAQSLAVLGQFERAALLLEAALAKDETGRVRKGLVELCLTWRAAVLNKKDEGSFAAALEILERALRYDPKDPRVLTQLAVQASKVPEQSERVQELLQDALASGKAPMTVHLVLGTAAIQSGELEKGIRHLEIAHEGNEQAPAILNNLAWGLAFSEEPDLERAGRMIDAAHKIAPNHPEILETRGQILAKQGRTKEAVASLEQALKTLKRPAIHKKLAELYETLGDADLAAAHRRRAEAE